jgi:DNA-binding transcriptional ArsR family regulator
LRYSFLKIAPSPSIPWKNAAIVNDTAAKVTTSGAHGFRLDISDPTRFRPPRVAPRGCQALTGDYLVTYSDDVTDDDRVFKALADSTRRFLLDRLFERDGRTLSELESQLDMTRFGVMKHLRVLEDADLVVTRRSGREKLHFLNPVPIRLIHDRWIDKYRERHVSALAELKTELEEEMA